MRYAALRYYREGSYDRMRAPVYHKVDDTFAPILNNNMLTGAAYIFRIKAEVNNMFYCVAATGDTNFRYIAIDETHPLFNLNVILRALYHIDPRQKVYNAIETYLDVAARNIYNEVVKEIEQR